MKHARTNFAMLSLTIVACLVYPEVKGQVFKNFFKPPVKTNAIGPAAAGTDDLGWQFKPTVVLHAFKVTKSTRPDTQADVSILASTGGGITLQHNVMGDNGKYKAKGMSISPVII